MKIIPVILCMFILSVAGYSQSYKGSIIRVIDGDTYVFQTEDGSFIVRMYGIDAPEGKQPFSSESADFLSQYLHKDVITNIDGTDRYGRRIGILICDGKDINLLSLRNGLSWHYKQYSKDEDYAEAEKYAIRKKNGLWKLDNPVPPWEWRKTIKK